MDNPAILIAAVLILLGCAAALRRAVGILFSWSLPDLNPPPGMWEE
jgi:hypothetical protein